MNSKYEPASWDLSGIGSDDIGRQMRKINSLVRNFEKEFRGKLRCNIREDRLLRALNLLNRIEEEYDRLNSNYGLRCSENPNDPELTRTKSLLEQFGVEVDNRTIFFDSWVQNDIKAKDLQRILNISGKYRKYIKGIYDEKRHALDDEVEKMVHYKDISGSSLIESVYGKLTSKFKFEVEVDGKVEAAGLQRLHELGRHPKASVRAESRQMMCEKFKDMHSVFGELYSAMAKDMHNEHVRTRGHDSVLSMTALADDVPKRTIETMIGVCREKRHVFNKFFELKKALCDVHEPMSIYDVRAPIRAFKGMKFSYGQAVELVLKSLGSFSPNMRKMAKRLIDSKHVNSLPKKDAVGESYCMYMPNDVMPYVRLNFEGSMQGVTDFAHEMGHTLHFMFSAGSNPFLLTDAPDPLCETASTFSEMLLIDSMLSDKCLTRKMKQELLVRDLNNVYANIMDSAYSIIFENEAFKMINSRKSADVEQIASLYYKLTKERVGKGIDVPECMRYFWINDENVFLMPLYNYSYVFGQLVTFALYNQYKKEGEEFVPRYEHFLSYGSSETPENILKEMGINIRSRAFWESGFDVIKKKIKTLEDFI